MWVELLTSGSALREGPAEQAAAHVAGAVLDRGKGSLGTSYPPVSFK
jgi:hypothetical protein